MENKYLRLLKICALSATLLPCAMQCRAQKLRYVTFFPVPFANHSSIFVKNKAIFGAGHNAEISFAGNINLGVKNDGDNFTSVQELFLSSQELVPISATQRDNIGEMDEDSNFSYPLESYFSTYSILLFPAGSTFASSTPLEEMVVNNAMTVKKLKFASLGEIDATSCTRLCWQYLKLPRELSFQSFLVCKETEGDCPVNGGYETVAQITRLYAVISGGSGYKIMGNLSPSGSWATVYNSSYLETGATVTYYTSLPTAPEVSGNATVTNGSYTGIGTFTFPSGVDTGTLSNATLYTESIPLEDCPSGVSAEMICQRTNAASYRCIRNKVTSSNFPTEYAAAATYSSKYMMVTPLGPSSVSPCCPGSLVSSCVMSGIQQQAYTLPCTLTDSGSCSSGCLRFYSAAVRYFEQHIIDNNTEVVSCL